MAIESPLLDATQAAEYIGMSRAWFMHTARKELPSLKRGRRLMFRREDLDAWIRMNLSQPPKPAA